MMIWCFRGVESSVVSEEGSRTVSVLPISFLYGSRMLSLQYSLMWKPQRCHPSWSPIMISLKGLCKVPLVLSHHNQSMFRRDICGIAKWQTWRHVVTTENLKLYCLWVFHLWF